MPRKEGLHSQQYVPAIFSVSNVKLCFRSLSLVMTVYPDRQKIGQDVYVYLKKFLSRQWKNKVNKCLSDMK